MLYLVAPTYDFLCRTNFVFGVTTAIHTILLHNAAIIVKYIFIFQLKNPTVIQDDFWNLFINLWIFFASLISQIIFQMLLGRDPMYLMVCSGKAPTQYLASTVKRNYTIIFLVLFSTIVNLHFFIEKFALKYFKKDKYLKYEQFNIKWANVVKKEKMFFYTSHFAGFLVLFFALVATPQIINSLNPKILDTSPYYILFYANSILYPQLSIMLTLSLFLFVRGLNDAVPSLIGLVLRPRSIRLVPEVLSGI
jgi:hypothetical protein